MRYVIVFAAIALGLIWDALYNNSHYLNIGVKALVDFMKSVGIG